MPQKSFRCKAALEIPPMDLAKQRRVSLSRPRAAWQGAAVMKPAQPTVDRRGAVGALVTGSIGVATAVAGGAVALRAPQGAEPERPRWTPVLGQIEAHREAWADYLRWDRERDEFKCGQRDLTEERAELIEERCDECLRLSDAAEEQTATAGPTTAEGCAQLIEYLLDDGADEVLCDFHIGALQRIAEVLHGMSAPAQA